MSAEARPGRPSIVFMTERLPFPLDNGLAIRNFNLLAAYADCGDVDLVFFYGDKNELSDLDAVARHCRAVHPISRSTCSAEWLRSLPRWRRWGRLLASRNPSFVERATSPLMRQVVRPLAASADLVHVARLLMVPNMGFLLGGLRRKRRLPHLVLDLDDIETVKRARYLKTGSGGWSRTMFGYYDLARLSRYQAAVLRSFDRVLVCSENDRDRLSSPNVVVVPNGANVPGEEPSDASDGKTLFYCGLLSYRPNIDAVLYFVEHVLPKVQQEIPDVRLVIAGRRPGPEISRLHDGKSIDVAADVPRIEEYFRRATALVVPLRIGGGTRIKILEAFAYGTAVVTTTVGCEGLAVEDRMHVLIADDKGSFADRCVEVIRDTALRGRLAREGRHLVSERYSWSAVRASMVDMVSGVLDRPVAAGEAVGGTRLPARYKKLYGD